MKIAIICFAIMLSGCATTPLFTKITPPSAETLSSLDYGSEPKEGHQEAIKSFMTSILKDPYSAQYRFEKPIKFWYKDPVFAGGKEYSGYLVVSWINAKNSFGGYTGEKRTGFIFKNDQIIKMISNEELEVFTYSLNLK